MYWRVDRDSPPFLNCRAWGCLVPFLPLHFDWIVLEQKR